MASKDERPIFSAWSVNVATDYDVKRTKLQ